MKLFLALSTLIVNVAAVKQFKGVGTVRCPEGAYVKSPCKNFYAFPCSDECILGSSLSRAYGSVFTELSCACSVADECHDACVFLEGDKN